MKQDIGALDVLVQAAGMFVFGAGVLLLLTGHDWGGMSALAGMIGYQLGRT